MAANFQEIVGLSRIKDRLKRTVAGNAVLNSYVFEGEPGSGKKTVARIFASAVLCSGEGERPCGNCPACAKTMSGNHPDILYVRKGKGKNTIGIDDVREQIMEQVYIKPFLAEKKFFIIEDGDDLTPGAQNGLLKVLEEPPDYVVFILLVSKAGNLLDTVLSRSVVLTFLPLSCEEVCSCLRKSGGHTEEEVLFAAKFSQGIVGRAEAILQSETFAEIYRQTLKYMQALAADRASATDFEKYLQEQRDQIKLVVDFMLVWVRDCLLIKCNLESMVLCRDHLFELRAFCAKVTKKTLVRAMDSILQYQKKLSQNASFNAASLEMLLSIREGMDDTCSRSAV